MLGKLLKYEFRATARILLPFLAGLLLISCAANLGVRLIDRGAGLTAVGAMLVVLYFLAIMAMGTVTLVLLVYRFYRNLLSDEGYLTFSLPAGIHAQLWCKLIASAVWIIAAFLVIVLSIVIVTSPVDLTGAVLSDMALMFERFSAAYGIGALELIYFALELLLLMLLAAMGGCLTFYASMSLGFGFSEHKLLYSVLIFFGIGIATQFIFAGVTLALGIGLANMPGFIPDFGAVLHVRSVLQLGHVFMLGWCAYNTVYCAALYAVTAAALKRRLNLP